ncbi:hypothetical protein L1994_10660 [Methanomicrobium antiquum]|uniref:Uncharacterized protein n=1 Tax=Methanomicrobium antiquum TaxID=487686 RepID=A0AAF0FRD0_9EURY|nr:hypothetical protein [Methanomicrobium antiquum]WFN36586.1 hypothetical protein L1994_10660 [Methanomicrobium antiquum]
MKYYWLVLLFIIGAALTVPAVSAKIIEEKDGYIVTSVDNAFNLSDIFIFLRVYLK